MNQIFIATYNALDELEQIEIEELIATIINERQGGGERAKSLYRLTQLMPETVRSGYTVEELREWLENN
jgi:hypothetical protein